MSILKIKDKNGVFKGVHTVSGKSATIKVGEVVTGEPGTDARVENVGTESDAIFNFTIPRGKTGTGTGGGVSDYDSLDNLPSINGVTIAGDMNSEDIIGKTAIYFNNFNDLKNYSKAELGQVLITLGYYEPGDNGGSTFVVKNTTHEDDGCSVVTFDNNLQAVMSVQNNSINMIQLGYLPNVATQDCHDSITQYVNICNRDGRKYELYFPAGAWCFSETDISNGRKGVILTGVSPNASNRGYDDITSICPFNDNQAYIWNFGKTSDTRELTGGNLVKYFKVTTGLDAYKKEFCETGILLTYCCYSDFDGIYFHYMRGAALTIQVGWENRFGYMDFRGVGYATKDFTYPGLWFKTHPVGSVPSAISANYFHYMCFEGVEGSCIYAEAAGNFIHSEIDDIQVEWTSSNHNSPDLTVEYLGEDIVTWDDEAENIEHCYVFKGSAGSNYNAILINNITASWTSPRCYKITHTADDGTITERYLRLSGILGLAETYSDEGYGLGVVVNNISTVGNTFPAFHSTNAKKVTGTSNINIGMLHNSLVPFQCKNMLKKTLTCNNFQLPKPGRNTEGRILYTSDFSGNTNLGYVGGSLNPNGLSVNSSAGTTEFYATVNGQKTLKLRIYLKCDSVDNFPYDINPTYKCIYRDGTEVAFYGSRIFKTDIEAGTYPLNEWFDFEIKNVCIPYDIFELKGQFSGEIYYVDCVKESGANRTVTASELTYSGMLKSAIGAQAWCTDKRETAEDELGVMMVFNGTEWKSIKGTKLSDLVS